MQPPCPYELSSHGVGMPTPWGLPLLPAVHPNAAQPGGALMGREQGIDLNYLDSEFLDHLQRIGQI